MPSIGSVDGEDCMNRMKYRRCGKICWAKPFAISTLLKFLRKYFHIDLTRSAYYLQEVLVFMEKLLRYS